MPNERYLIRDGKLEQTRIDAGNAGNFVSLQRGKKTDEPTCIDTGSEFS
jgi:hypothetical protein